MSLLRVVSWATVALAWLSGCTVLPVSPPEPSGTGGVAGDAGGGGGGDDGGGGLLQPDASACQPADVRTFHSSGYHPANGLHQGLCDDTLVADFYARCLGTSASTADCSAFQTDHPACFGCILTGEKAKDYGPLVDHSSFVTGNVSGCLELVLGSAVEAGPAALTCAQAVQARSMCELAACEANCAVHDAASLTAFGACSDAADTGGCQSFVAAAACADAAAAVDTRAARCLSLDFKSFYDMSVPLFCGFAPPAGDAGTGGDGGAGAPDAAE